MGGVVGVAFLISSKLCKPTRLFLSGLGQFGGAAIMVFIFIKEPKIYDENQMLET